MRRKGRLHPKIMPEDFEDEERTLYQRIVSDKKSVVPNHLALQRRHSDGKPDQGEQGDTYPLVPGMDR